MVQADTGRFGSASRGKTGIIYVPADLVKDTTFPFADGILASVGAAMFVSFISGFSGASLGVYAYTPYLAIVVSAVGLVATAFVRSKTKLSGAIMILAGLMGFPLVSVWYILPGVLFVVAGVLALIRK